MAAPGSYPGHIPITGFPRAADADARRFAAGVAVYDVNAVGHEVRDTNLACRRKRKGRERTPGPSSVHFLRRYGTTRMRRKYFTSSGTGIGVLAEIGPPVPATGSPSGIQPPSRRSLTSAR